MLFVDEIEKISNINITRNIMGGKCLSDVLLATPLIQPIVISDNKVYNTLQ